jgi:manganese/zinc/iron transport system substrate-binding protein
MKKILALLLTLSLFASCQMEKEAPADIVCTTGMIGDMVQQLVGDSLKVVSLMGPGVDPHLYKATQGDVQQLSNAAVIVHNGLHLEGKMTEIFEKLKDQKEIIKVSDALEQADLINSTDFVDAHDPHIWFDAQLWRKCLFRVSAELKRIYPNLAQQIDERTTRYQLELFQLHEYARTQIELIPENQRIMITAHDAFKYFGKAYNMEVKGLQGISTTAELGLQDVSQLVQYITERRIKAIFVESSVPKKSIEAVIEGCAQKGHDLKMGGELFSDAMGSKNTPEGSYIGMVRHNVNTLVNALK